MDFSKTVRWQLDVPVDGKIVGFQKLPDPCPGKRGYTGEEFSYEETKKRLENAGLRVPSFKEIFSLVTYAKRNPQDDVCKEISYTQSYRSAPFAGYTGVYYGTDGILIEENPTIIGDFPSTPIERLEVKFRQGDKLVKKVPFGKDLEERLILSLVGENGLKDMSELGYKNYPYMSYLKKQKRGLPTIGRETYCVASNSDDWGYSYGYNKAISIHRPKVLEPIKIPIGVYKD